MRDLVKGLIVAILAMFTVVGLGIVHDIRATDIVTAVQRDICTFYDGPEPVNACAPAESPHGAPIVGKVEEDGSAGYADGQTFDPGFYSMTLPAGTVYGPDGEAVVIPDGADIDTTPVRCWTFPEEWDHDMCVPEESPNGGYVVDWADNSPVYSDGWMMQIDDVTGHVEFIWDETIARTVLLYV